MSETNEIGLLGLHLPGYLSQAPLEVAVRELARFLLPTMVTPGDAGKPFKPQQAAPYLYELACRIVDAHAQLDAAQSGVPLSPRESRAMVQGDDFQPVLLTCMETLCTLPDFPQFDTTPYTQEQLHAAFLEHWQELAEPQNILRLYDLVLAGLEEKEAEADKDQCDGGEGGKP